MSFKEIENQIDRLWQEFWQGGITNPLTVIEQISFLIFARLLDINESRDQRKFNKSGKPFKPRFSDDEQHLRWSEFQGHEPGKMLALMRDEIFPHFKKVGGEGSTFSEYFEDAILMIQKPALLARAVSMVDQLPLTDDDTKGNLYEYLLSKLTTAGINGQFRTPRHIIEMMVEITGPRVEEKIGDPACGTAGFLVEAMKYLMRENTSPTGILTEGDGTKIYTGDLLTEQQTHTLKTDTFFGFDFDSTMLRISSMNLLLHGVDNPQVHYQDTMSQRFEEAFPGLSQNCFDLILANPPFKGSLDFDDVAPDLLKEVRTKKTELLFIALFLRLLKPGGRCAVIVPDGVLFGSSNAHKEIRKTLLDEHQLEAVISMPSGVFKPYAGVSTAVLYFTKDGKTKDVWFYDMQADGLSLDDKRTKLDQSKHEDNNIPDIIRRWKERKSEYERKSTDQSFYVPKEEIIENDYDLSINRYKEIVYKEENYDPPKVILKELMEMEKEIQRELFELDGMLG
jgi:type I restriction enzyme M protein